MSGKPKGGHLAEESYIEVDLSKDQSRSWLRRTENGKNRADSTGNIAIGEHHHLPLVGPDGVQHDHHVIMYADACWKVQPHDEGVDTPSRVGVESHLPASRVLPVHGQCFLQQGFLGHRAEHG